MSSTAPVPKIREATVSDVPALVSLNRIVQRMHADALPERFRKEAPDDIVAEAFSEMIESSSSYWLVAGEQQIVGFLSAEFRERDENWVSTSHRVCYLAGIAVAPDFRRLGIARALFERLRREVCFRNLQQLELDVWSFNDEARGFFEKLGFRPVMERMTLTAEAPGKRKGTMEDKGE